MTRIAAALLGLMLFAVLPAPSRAALVVDLFEAPQTEPGSVVDRTIGRDERDLRVDGGAAAAIGGGRAAFDLPAGGSVVLEYDGADVVVDAGDPATWPLVSVGRGVFDLLQRGTVADPAFMLNVLSVSGAPRLTVTISDFSGLPPDRTIRRERATVSVSAAGPLAIPLADFGAAAGAGVNRDIVREIRFRFDADSAASLVLGAIEVAEATPLDGDVHTFPNLAGGLPDPLQRVVAGLPADANPQAVVYVDGDRVLIADAGNGRLFDVTPSSGMLTSTIELLDSGYDGNGSIALAPDRRTLLAAAGSRLFAFALPDPTLGWRVLSLPGEVPPWQTQAVAFHPLDGRAFVYHRNGISVLAPPYRDIGMTLHVPDTALTTAAPQRLSGALAFGRDGVQLLATGLDPAVRLFAAPYRAVSAATALDLSVVNARQLDGIAIAGGGETLIVDAARNDAIFALGAGPFAAAAGASELVVDGVGGSGFERIAVSDDAALLAVAGGNRARDADDGRVVVADGLPQVVTLLGAERRNGGAVALQPVGRGQGLTLDKDAPSAVALNGSIDYTLSYENRSATPATGAMLRDTVPAGTTLLAVRGGGSVVGDDIVWDLGTVPGNSGPLTVGFNVSADRRGPIHNGAAALSADGLSASVMAPAVTTAVESGPPTAADDLYAVDRNGVLDVTAGAGLLVNDSDPYGTTLHAVQTSEPGRGSLSFFNDGAFVYTPDRGFSGTDRFRYRADNGVAQSAETTVLIAVETRSGPPRARHDGGFSVPRDGILVSARSVLDNDSDPQNAALSARLVTRPSHGTVSLGRDGRFVYLPASGYRGDDSFLYEADDGASTSVPARVNLVVTANVAPVAHDDHYVIGQDTTLTLTAAQSVLNNDVDPEGHTLLASKVSGPARGSLTLADDGTFVYTPAPGYSGADRFDYQAFDGAAAAQATVSLSVVAVSAPPAALDDTYRTPRGRWLSVAAPGVLVNDRSSPPGRPLRVESFGAAAGGQLSRRRGGGFIYRPNPGFVGVDTFTYTVTDGTSNSDPATVTIHVDAPNKAPQTTDLNYTLSLSSATLSVAAPGLLRLASDPEGHTLSARLAAPLTAANGVVRVAADGSFVYAPAPGAGPETVRFDYIVSDGELDSAPATATIELVGDNRPPTAVDDRYALPQGTVLTVPAPGFLANDSDAESGPLTVLLQTRPAGALQFRQDGSFDYRPDAGFTGADRFVYRLDDGERKSGSAEVTLRVTPAAENGLPSLTPPGGLSVVSGGVLRGPNLLAGAADPDGHALSVTIARRARNGSVDLNPDGTFEYHPDPGFTGIDTFRVTVTDGLGSSAEEIVNIRVDEAPGDTVFADQFETAESD